MSKKSFQKYSTAKKRKNKRKLILKKNKTELKKIKYQIKNSNETFFISTQRNFIQFNLAFVVKHVSNPFLRKSKFYYNCSV